MDLPDDQSNKSATMKSETRQQEIRSIVHDYYRDVYRFAFRLSGSVADAEDLTQQTFLTACRKIEQLRSPERVRSWLFTIVRNNYLKSRRNQTVELSVIESEFVEDPEEVLPDHFDEERLQQVLNEMPEAFRIPVLCYYFEELNYKEIAAALDLPIGTVMSRLSRGKQFLRSRMIDQEQPEESLVPSHQSTDDTLRKEHQNGLPNNTDKARRTPGRESFPS